MPSRFSAWKPGGRVGDALADDARDDPGQKPDPDAPRARRAIAARADRGEARADDDVGFAVQHRCEHAVELRGIVLAVAVDAYRDVVVVLEREAEAGLHCAADAEVERQPQHACTLRRRRVRRAVERAVVDDDDVEPRIERAQLVDHAPDVLRLVQRGDDRDTAELSQARIDAHREDRNVRGRRGHPATRPRRRRSRPRPPPGAEAFADRAPA